MRPYHNWRCDETRGNLSSRTRISSKKGLTETKGLTIAKVLVRLHCRIVHEKSQ